MKNYFQNEQGLSLIEVIASMVLITIILLSFIGLFIQSNKTSKTSSTIVDATYLAQVEMENIYTQSKTTKFDEITQSTTAPGLGYPVLNSPDTTSEARTPDYSEIYTFKKTEQNHQYKLTIKKRDDYSNLVNVIIEVYKDNVLKSKMENIYKWM